MSLKMEDARKILETFERLKKKGKRKLSAIDEMEGCFTDLFPKEKSSVDIIRENREKMFEK